MVLFNTCFPYCTYDIVRMMVPFLIAGDQPSFRGPSRSGPFRVERLGSRAWGCGCRVRGTCVSVLHPHVRWRV